MPTKFLFRTYKIFDARLRLFGLRGTRRRKAVLFRPSRKQVGPSFLKIRTIS